MALTTASAFLAVMSILIGSAALFYITTALIATLGACRLQAWLSVRGLKLERVAPASVQVGDLVTVEISVLSEYKIPRPLITFLDSVPPKIAAMDLTPSLPVAPAYDMPIRTQYRFRPGRRGKYRWSGVVVEGTDALGLVTKRHAYDTAPAEMLVLPRPIPVSVELPSAAGWGISEAESGQTRGAGLEPRGIRQYHYGDSLRHVHWRSTARTGQLLVKEFEAGSQAAVAFLIQQTAGSDIGEGPVTTLELMCGHVAFLAETFLRQGARIELPGLDENPSHFSPHERVQEIYHSLANVLADSTETVSEATWRIQGVLPPGSVLFTLLSLAEDALPDAVAILQHHGTTVVPLLYDAEAFHRGKRPLGRRSAVDSAFVERLHAAGAHPVVMPTETESGEVQASREQVAPPARGRR